MQKWLKIRGARQHNLKNINLDLPKGKLIVFSGISGSGKSSLAFDTIYAEGQRRYVESLSAYARQFLGVMEKPDFDRIEGLAPTISIGQKKLSVNPRSTVGTVTEIYDYLRLLFARIGHPHCPHCQREISSQSPAQIEEQIIKLLQSKRKKGSSPQRCLLLAPLVKERKGEYSRLLERLKKEGWARVRIDGQIYSLDEDLVLIRTNRHTIELVVDRFAVRKIDDQLRQRLNESIAKALRWGEGTLILSLIHDASFDFPEKPQKMEDFLFSELFACPYCNLSLPELEPRSFSFNSPQGACEECDGLGMKWSIDPSKVYNPDLTINQGGFFPWSSVGEGQSWQSHLLQALAAQEGFSLDVPIKELPEKILEKLLFGSPQPLLITLFSRRGEKKTYRARFEGLIPQLQRRYRETTSDKVRQEISRYMRQTPCSRCQGQRLKKEILKVTVGGKNIAQLTALPLDQLQNWFSEVLASPAAPLSPREKEIAAPITKELQQRLQFLLDVGLNYLTLDRLTATLSTGEAQRIRLASQIGAALSGVIYVLDEPSVGLHYRDHQRLLQTLFQLRDLDNTVIVVEHDPLTIREADWVVDFGPGAGAEGGKIVASGTPQEIAANPQSLTGQYLSGQRRIKIPPRSAAPPTDFLVLRGCREHNLKNIDVRFPLGKFICVTGVSGSGKSTLVMDTLYPRLAAEKGLQHPRIGKHRHLEGAEKITKVINIDQSPIGRTPRSNPATYTGVFTLIRELFAALPESRARGYNKGRFSFNLRSGRCENCQGEGLIKIEMQFLPDLYVNCEICQGRRYNRETLEIRYKELTIAAVLDLSIKEAAAFFSAHPLIQEKLTTLLEVGLGYLKLGQPAPTLSGGEAQRIKLAKELSRRPRGHTFYILDEPTTGLHSYDIENLLRVLHRLVAQGHTVVVIEHNLEVIRTADWIIDLGPEGGNQGGRVVVAGPLSTVIKHPRSYTAAYLRQMK